MSIASCGASKLPQTVEDRNPSPFLEKKPAPPQVARRAYTVNEFCEAHGIGRTTFYDQVAKGLIRVLKVGRKTIVPIAESENWMKRLSEVTE
jgi:excisionase family DNA binding protein